MSAMGEAVMIAEEAQLMTLEDIAAAYADALTWPESRAKRIQVYALGEALTKYGEVAA